MALGKRRRAAALVLLLFFAASQEQLSITKPANAVLVARPIMRSNAPALGGAAGRLRGSSVPISAECLAGRSCSGVRRSGGKAGRGKPTSSIRMVFDQFDPRGRSKVWPGCGLSRRDSAATTWYSAVIMAVCDERGGCGIAQPCDFEDGKTAIVCDIWHLFVLLLR